MATSSGKPPSRNSEKDMEVLFQYQGHRCTLKCKRSVMREKVEEALITLQAGLPGSSAQSASRIEVHTLQSIRKPAATKKKHKDENKSIYLLQRYVSGWKVFVNVDNAAQIRNRDVITVTVAQSVGQHHSNTADSLNLPKSQQEHEVHSTSKSSHEEMNKRDTAVSVIALKKFTKTVPKNTPRRELISEGRIKTLYFYRDDDEICVDSTLKKEFGLTNYLILDCDQSGNLSKSTLKEMNGSQAIARRRGLYICEVGSDKEGKQQISRESSSSEDEGFPIPTTKKGRSRKRKEQLWESSISEDEWLPYNSTKGKGKQQKVSDYEVIVIPDSDDDVAPHSDDDLPPLPTRRVCMWNPATFEDTEPDNTSFGNTLNNLECVTSQQTSAVSIERQRSIQESRCIMEEQDREYNASLKADEEKEKLREQQSIEKKNTVTNEKYDGLRTQLLKKWEDITTGSGPGIWVTLRFPDGAKVKAFINEDCTARALYEIAFSRSMLTEPFRVYTILPRELILPSTPISQLHIQGSLLTVELCEDAEDPLVILAQKETQEEVLINTRENPIQRVAALRLEFLKRFTAGCTHIITRQNLFNDMVGLYNSSPAVVREHPFKIKFTQERAIDAGGVGREAFSGFWEAVYRKMFDGAALLVPALHHKIDVNAFPILGKIISHGYLTCGYLPLRVAFPVIAAVLLGPLVIIPDCIILESFVDYLVEYEGQLLRCALQDLSLVPSQADKLLSFLSRHGCLEIPTPDNLIRIVTEVARCELTTKVLGATYAMHSGISEDDKCFWAQHGVADLYTLYKSLEVTHEKVLNMIAEPVEMSASQNKVFGFFVQYIGCLNIDRLRLLLRFMTGSSVILPLTVDVLFNVSTTYEPIVRTCGPYIELSSLCTSYTQFEHTFNCVLENEETWKMNIS